MKRRALPTLAIVGRTNVGKSTLFNRICEEQKAIVSTVPGTTRDRNFGSVIWRGGMFIAVDTAGLDVPERELEEVVRAQIKIALAECDAIAFVVDVRSSGPTKEDRALAKELQKGKKPVILAVNKCDGPSHRAEGMSDVWRQLGMGVAIPISAVNGSGVGDFLDAARELLLKSGKPMPEAVEEPATRVTIIGQPNVGKSSLVNALVGEERVVVSSFAGTTREPQDTFVLFEGHPFLIVDTVGIQRRSKTSLESVGVKRSLEAIKLSDVVFLVLDASYPPTSQDKRLAGEISKARKGAAVVVNKWDLVPDKKTNTVNEYADMVHTLLPFVDWAPVLFVSAKTKERVETLYRSALAIMEERRKVIPEETLEKFIRDVQRAPMKGQGVAHPKTYRFSQNGSVPPSFILVAKGAVAIPDAYTNFLEKRLRERFGFEGTPIRMQTKTIKS